MSDGNRRKMPKSASSTKLDPSCSNATIRVEVSSNFERFRAVDFKWAPNTWYHSSPAWTSLRRHGRRPRKAWKRGETEPEAWTIEVKHKTGAPGRFAGLVRLSPQTCGVYIDIFRPIQLSFENEPDDFYDLAGSFDLFTFAAIAAMAAKQSPICFPPNRGLPDAFGKIEFNPHG